MEEELKVCMGCYHEIISGIIWGDGFLCYPCAMEVEPDEHN